MEFTADGSGMYVNTAESITLWDWEKGTIVHSTDLEYPISDTEFSAEGKYLKLRNQVYPRVILHDVATFEEVGRLVEEEPENTTELMVNSHRTVFSPADPHLAVETVEGTIGLYDYEEGDFFREIVTDRRVSELAFSADGKVLYTAGAATSFPGPKGGGAWEVATGEELTSGDTLIVNRLSLHPDGAALATFAGDTLLFLDPDTFEVINEIS